MPAALFGLGVFGSSKWGTLEVTGAITESPDITSGSISVIEAVYGAVTESPDVVNGVIADGAWVFGEITESPDVVAGLIKVTAAPTERRGGGWAPQHHYKREWEKTPELEIIEEIVEIVEPEAEFVPTPLPIDPAVARMIEAMMRGPQPVDTDEEDIEALLMQL